MPAAIQPTNLVGAQVFCSTVGHLGLASALVMFGFGTMQCTYAFYIEGNFAWGGQQLGIILVVSGLVIAVCQAKLIKPAVERYGKHGVAVIGCVMLGGGLLGYPFLHTQNNFLLAVHLLFFGLHVVGFSVTNTAFPALASRYARAGMQGRAMGLVQGCQAVARVITPFVSGALYDASEALACEPCAKLCTNITKTGEAKLEWTPAMHPTYDGFKTALLALDHAQGKGLKPNEYGCLVQEQKECDAFYFVCAEFHGNVLGAGGLPYVLAAAGAFVAGALSFYLLLRLRRAKAADAAAGGGGGGGTELPSLPSYRRDGGEFSAEGLELAGTEAAAVGDLSAAQVVDAQVAAAADVADADAAWFDIVEPAAAVAGVAGAAEVGVELAQV